MNKTRIALAFAPVLFFAGALSAQTTGDPFIEQMTWTEIRDAMAAGKTTVIVPIGGTEQNGPHMVMGKHNYVITFAAGQMARQLGNALVAPTIAWVPEGSYEREGFGDKPGVITNPSPSYNNLLEATARSLESHGFAQILFIGDSGGNQGGMSEVADRLGAEWAGGSTKIFALTDFYAKGQEYSRAWLMAAYGYDMETIGSHAGITDTSAVMYVFADGVRNDRRYRFGGREDAGVTGDPTLASPEIGRMVVHFKIVGALNQLEALTAPPRRGRGGGPGS
ncbi:MAG: creatininase family protein [Gemmatimonadetes bacterium]|nr:creatininase family protein [Gemmatimonadota bacterium]MDA1102965.1 creatininase family protein [Gemmatimonadota bacterium]